MAELASAVAAAIAGSVTSADAVGSFTLTLTVFDDDDSVFA